MDHTFPLSGIRIWLSGSIPENADDNERERLLAFVRTMAARAFGEGATVAHGFHPSITKTLLEAAEKYRADSSGERAPLRLMVSTHFRSTEGGGSYAGQPIAAIRQVAELVEVPGAGNREDSLLHLRNTLAAQADVLVAVGGKWWKVTPQRAGVPAEFNLAITRGIPTFLAGGFGGATDGYLERDGAILRNLRNGFGRNENEELAFGKLDAGKAAGKILEQMARLPLGRRETSGGQPFRILCLDGGGIRGAFTAAVLAKWEELNPGRRLADHFDLIAGTSTGGMLAIGLGLGLSGQRLVQFYKDHGETIFPMATSPQRGMRWVLHWFTNKFNAPVLESVLKQAYDAVVPDATLGHSKQRLLVTTYNLTTNTPIVLRTSHHPSVTGNDALLAVKAALATSAAPTYFEPAIVEQAIATHESVDGGMWANCPALVAVGEAMSVLQIPLERIDLLSVGTAGLPALIDNPTVEGKVGWASRAPDLLLTAQLDATVFYLKQLLGDRFLRVDDPRPRVEGLDESQNLSYLIGRGVEVAEMFAGEVKRRFINGVPADPWRGL